jgi:hypothetical protein
LQRRVAAQYGNDPINWDGALPTPGLANSTGDSDFDGVPDEWELTYGTDPGAADATADPDGDGVSNFDEFIAGTHPNNSSSKLTITLNPSAELSFNSVMGRLYTVQWSPMLPGTWSDVASDVPGTGTTLSVPIADAGFVRVNVRRQ